MWWLIIAVYGVVYISNIFSNLFALYQIKKCTNKLYTFIETVKDLSPHITKIPENCSAAYEELMRYSPIVSKYSYSALSYDECIFENLEKSEHLCNIIRMKYNEQRHKLFATFNPIIAFKIFLRLPSTILSWMGFSIKDKTRGWIDIIGTVVIYSAEMFQPEIKQWILSIFSNSH